MYDHKREVAKAVDNLLDVLGCSKNNPNFVDTPRRVSTYLLEHFRTKAEIADALELLSQSVFPADYDTMVICNGIKAEGICPHHLLPVRYNVSIGYIPKGNVIGLSKLARAAELILSQPITQESATTKLVDSLETMLTTTDIGVVVKGQHMCMCVRGVKNDSVTITSIVRGCLRSEPEARAEFLKLVETGTKLA